MRIGVNLNALDSSQLVPAARAAEEFGFESVWLGEHVIMPRALNTSHPSGVRPQAALEYLHHEPFSALAAIATATTQLRLGTGVCLLPLRDPFNAARAAATVDVLSGGRLLMGVGLGWSPEEYEILGINWHTRGARLDEAVHLVRVLWSEENPEFGGRFYRCPPVGFRPKPFQGRAIPVLIGTHSSAGIRRAARIGDGLIGMATSLEGALNEMRILRLEVIEAGRELTELELTAGVGRDFSPAAVERLHEAGYNRVSVGLVPTDGPIAWLADTARSLGALMTG